MIDHWLQVEIVCARINVRLARERGDLRPSERQAEIEVRQEKLNELLDRVPRKALA